MKLCKICRIAPAEIPDREHMGRPIKKVCRECHRKRLLEDLQVIIRGKKQDEGEKGSP